MHNVHMHGCSELAHGIAVPVGVPLCHSGTGTAYLFPHTGTTYRFDCACAHDTAADRETPKCGRAGEGRIYGELKLSSGIFKRDRLVRITPFNAELAKRNDDSA